MLVTVERRHIRAGKRNDNKFCPVALAVKELPGVTDVSVGSSGTTIFMGKKYTRYKLPAIAIEFVEAFDRGRFVQPTSFDITEREY